MGSRRVAFRMQSSLTTESKRSLRPMQGSPEPVLESSLLENLENDAGFLTLRSPATAARGSVTAAFAPLGLRRREGRPHSWRLRARLHAVAPSEPAQWTDVCLQGSVLGYDRSP